jgi:hypothetical protein
MSNIAALLSRTKRIAIPTWLPVVAVFALAAGMRGVLVANPDVSWGLTMAEKIVNGQQLYVDVIETNPPAAMFLYVVPAWLAGLAGVRAEFVVGVLVLFAAALSLWLAGRILVSAKLLADRDGWLLATIAAVALTVLPAATFGEKEHIALIVFLPFLAASASRAAGRLLDLPMAIVAGIGAGIAVVVKPHFAVAIIATATASAVCARSWRPLFAIEDWTAAAVAITYGACVCLAYPQFVSDVLPLVVTVYVPVKVDFWRFVIAPGTTLWLLALGLIVWLKRGAALKPPFCLLLAASFGFAISYFVQRKGWPYHSYPMLALAVIALAIAFIDRWHYTPSSTAGSTDNGRLASAIIAALIAGFTFYWMMSVLPDRSGLAAAVRALKPHPKILAITGDLSIGHPLTRQVDGIWVGRSHSLWITECVLLRQKYETLDAQTNARLNAYAARDRAMLTQDIARQRPDVILVERAATFMRWWHGPEGSRASFDWANWANSDPVLAQQLEHYREYKTVDDVLILRREDGP